MIDTTTNTSTNATTPRHIWTHEVVTLAGVTVAEMETHCGRDRLGLWYRSGEPVWMAAASLRTFVEIGKREGKADREVEALAAALRTR